MFPANRAKPPNNPSQRSIENAINYILTRKRVSSTEALFFIENGIAIIPELEYNVYICDCQED